MANDGDVLVLASINLSLFFLKLIPNSGELSEPDSFRTWQPVPLVSDPKGVPARKNLFEIPDGPEVRKL